MDLEEKRAFQTGDWTMHINALDNIMSALERNLLSFTLWNYTPQNTNERGDHWNDEDLSLFSRDQLVAQFTNDPYAGGRALAVSPDKQRRHNRTNNPTNDPTNEKLPHSSEWISNETDAKNHHGWRLGPAPQAAIRPYARKVAGEPLSMAFELDSRAFSFSFRPDAPFADSPTEIFVPRYQYPRGVAVEVSSGRYEVDAPQQMLRFWHDGSGEQTVRLSDDRPASSDKGDKQPTKPKKRPKKKPKKEEQAEAEQPTNLGTAI